MKRKILISALLSLTLLTPTRVSAGEEEVDTNLSFGLDMMASSSYSVSNTKDYNWNSELEILTMGSACGYRITFYEVTGDYENAPDQEQFVKDNYASFTPLTTYPYYIFNEKVLSSYEDSLRLFLCNFNNYGDSSRELLSFRNQSTQMHDSVKYSTVKNGPRNLTNVVSGESVISKAQASSLLSAFNWDSFGCSFDMGSWERTFKSVSTGNFRKHLSSRLHLTDEKNIAIYVEPLVCMGIDIVGYQDANGNTTYDDANDKFGINQKLLLTPSDISRIKDFDNHNTGGTSLFNTTVQFTENFMNSMNSDGVADKKGAVAFVLGKEFINAPDTLWETIPTVRFVETVYDNSHNTSVASYNGGATIDPAIWNEITDVLKFAKHLTETEPTSALYNTPTIKKRVSDTRKQSRCAYDLTADKQPTDTYKDEYLRCYQYLWDAICSYYLNTPVTNWYQSTTGRVTPSQKFTVSGQTFYTYSGVGDPSSLTSNLGDPDYKYHSISSFGNSDDHEQAVGSTTTYNVADLKVGDLLRNPYKYFAITGDTRSMTATGTTVARPLVIINDENVFGYPAVYCTIQDSYYENVDAIMKYIRDINYSEPSCLNSFNNTVKDRVNEARKCLEYLEYFHLPSGVTLKNLTDQLGSDMWQAEEPYKDARNEGRRLTYNRIVCGYIPLVGGLINTSSDPNTFSPSLDGYILEVFNHNNKVPGNAVSMNNNLAGANTALNSNVFSWIGDDKDWYNAAKSNTVSVTAKDSYSTFVLDKNWSPNDFNWIDFNSDLNLTRYGQAITNIQDELLWGLKDNNNKNQYNRPMYFIASAYTAAYDNWKNLQSTIFEEICNYYNNTSVVSNGNLNHNILQVIGTNVQPSALSKYHLDYNYVDNKNETIEYGNIYGCNGVPGHNPLTMTQRPYKMYVYNLTAFDINTLRNTVSTTGASNDIKLGDLFKNPQTYGISYNSKEAEILTEIPLEPWAYATETIQSGPGITDILQYIPDTRSGKNSLAFIENNGTPNHVVDCSFEKNDHYADPEIFKTKIIRNPTDNSTVSVSKYYTPNEAINRVQDFINSRITNDFADELNACKGVPVSNITFNPVSADARKINRDFNDTIIPSELMKRDVHGDPKTLAKFDLNLQNSNKVPGTNLPDMKQYAAKNNIWNPKLGTTLSTPGDTANIFKFISVYPMRAVNKFSSRIVSGTGLSTILKLINPKVMPAHDIDTIVQPDNTLWCYADEESSLKTWRAVSTKYTGICTLSGDWSTDGSDIEAIADTKAPVTKAGGTIMFEVKENNNEYRNYAIIDVYDVVSAPGLQTEFTSNGLTADNFLNEMQTIQAQLGSAKLQIASTLSGISDVDSLGVQYTDTSKKGNKQWFNAPTVNVSATYSYSKVVGRFGQQIDNSYFSMPLGYVEEDMNGIPYYDNVQARLYNNLYQSDWIYTDFEGLMVVHARFVVNFGSPKGTITVSKYESDSLDTQYNSRYISDKSRIDNAWKTMFEKSYNPTDMNCFMPYIDFNGQPEVEKLLGNTKYLCGGLTYINIRKSIY